MHHGCVRRRTPIHAQNEHPAGVKVQAVPQIQQIPRLHSPVDQKRYGARRCLDEDRWKQGDIDVVGFMFAAESSDSPECRCLLPFVCA